MAGRIDTDPDAWWRWRANLSTPAPQLTVRSVRSEVLSTAADGTIMCAGIFLRKNLEAIAKMAKQIEAVSDESQRMLTRKAQQLQAYLGR